MPVLDYSDPQLPTPADRLRPALGFGELLLPTFGASLASFANRFAPVPAGLVMFGSLICAVVVTARHLKWRWAVRKESSPTGSGRAYSVPFRIVMAGGLLVAQVAGMVIGGIVGEGASFAVRGLF